KKHHFDLWLGCRLSGGWLSSNSGDAVSAGSNSAANDARSGTAAMIQRSGDLMGSVAQAPWGRILLTGAGLVFVAWIFFHSERKEWPTIPGWDDLIYCSEVQSLDGYKQLSFSANHVVQFYENRSSKDRKEKRTVIGTWSFDENSKRYTVTLNDATTV